VIAGDAQNGAVGEVQQDLGGCPWIGHGAGGSAVSVSPHRPYLQRPFACSSAVPAPFERRMPPWRHNDRGGGVTTRPDAYVGGLNK
jgi:hypothetical protein